ncbi:N-acyl-D-amino-acid deacylase family protein [Gelidibacter japonicus]|uniref:N-acyl-D-amino-acid deacylase family protein n=1 Tax=Gelidibacter japonicus TaxID=1962232 RepID=UPI0013D2FC0E|nr:D-aminoacylase [Gelidibacter japonicus]
MKIKYLIITFIGVGFISCNSGKRQSFDLVIKGGLVNIGDGSPSIQADIGINADTIAYIGQINGSNSHKIIDAKDLVITPGFIDMHAHLDPIFKHPDAKSNITQGITTALGGPDGGGFWPFDKYLDSISKEDLGINVAYLVGHNTVRKNVMGMDNRAPTQQELGKMKAMVEEAMKDGAFGISTGLKYLPGAFSNVDEVIALSKSASKYGGIYTSHLREEGLGLIEGVEEAIKIGKEANIPIVLTHHKVVGKPMWGSSVKTLALVDAARENGIDVMLDQYPYDASYTSISILIPAWCRAGGQNEFLKRVGNKKLKDSILKGIEYNILNDRGGGDIERVQFAKVEWDTTLLGKTLKFWAEREGLEPTPSNGAKLVLTAQVNGGASAIFHAMNEEDLKRILKHPQTMIGSDGRLTAPGEAWPHPRWYGTFPRVLGRYVRDLKVIDLPTAIKKMTSMPADRLNLAKRGRLKVGNYADIVVFNPETIMDKSTFLNPHQYSVGIEYVMVNGVLTIDKGEFTSNRAGKVLRGAAYSKE